MRHISYKIFCGVLSIHEKGIAHRDLKYDNIIVNISNKDISTSKSLSSTFDKLEIEKIDKHFVENIKVKIIDFNVSRYKTTKNTSFIYDKESKKNLILYSIAGTPQFSAPELLENLSCYTEQVDIWAVGCCLYYLCLGQIPFKTEL